MADMKTYQDWLEVADKSDKDKMAFIKTLISLYKSSPMYENAIIGEDYYKGENTTIRAFEKYLYNEFGEAVKDVISANHKVASKFFKRDVVQANSVLLGNGVTWADGIGGETLGKDFDRRLMYAGKKAQIAGVSYGFFNNKKVVIFKAQEFIPLKDEEDGLIKAGVRFWQLTPNKPLRATMYELDGYTEYMYTKEDPEGIIKNEKRPYIYTIRESEADGEEILEGKNYPTFPIVPLYANDTETSELTSLRQGIDAYDLIKSGYANDQDDANTIYWTITNASGMTDRDLITVIDKLRKMHSAQLDDDQQIQSHSTEAPYQGREAILDRIEKDLYKDAMMLNTYDIASGAVTATQIQAAYEPLDEKLDDYETCISEFIAGLLEVAGVEDEPTYDRSYIVNTSETLDNISKMANYLPESYIREKTVTLLGDKDQLETIEDELANESVNRFNGGKENNPKDNENET